MEHSRITVLDRLTGNTFNEKVYGESLLRAIYEKPLLTPLKHGISRCAFVSKGYGWLQKGWWSKKKIQPFIQKYAIDTSEFLESVDSFRSFNDFFIRKLKPSARPISAADAVIPADGRYFFYENIEKAEGFVVKGQKFSLKALLGDDLLAEKYKEAAMVMARLCPTDYHRFHVPVDGVGGSPRQINGYLYSVNPIAVRQNISIFSENKRVITSLSSDLFGDVIFIEVGATNVGSIVHTSQANAALKKGDEKGYFEFGGSSLIVLFPKGAIAFDSDLLEATHQGMEIRCLMGQSMGLAVASHFRK